MKRAIARITVGASRGTGFLVAADRRVLTALHVVADLAASRRNGRLVLLPGEVRLRFGDALAGTDWAPAGPARLVPGLYSLGDDWAVLTFDGAVPADVAPLELADLAPAAGAGWQTFGFPDAAGAAGGDYVGTVTSWADKAARLESAMAAGLAMSGISGAPCVVGGQVAALIDRAVLTQDLCQGGVLIACPARVIAEGAAGHLPFDRLVAVPFELDVAAQLPTSAAALKLAAGKLGIPPPKATVEHVARALIVGGVTRAARVVALMAAPVPARAEVIDRVAAAQLHPEAVEVLATASQALVPGVVPAGSDRICDWYTQRARHRLDEDPWGARLFQVDVGEHLDTTAAASDDAAAVALLEFLRDRAAERPRDERAYLRRALDDRPGAPGEPICIALHGENRVPVVVALRARLPRAHILMVHPTALVLSDAERALVATVAPHVDDESALVSAHEGAHMGLLAAPPRHAGDP